MRAECKGNATAKAGWRRQGVKGKSSQSRQPSQKRQRALAHTPTKDGDTTLKPPRLRPFAPFGEVCRLLAACPCPLAATSLLFRLHAFASACIGFFPFASACIGLQPRCLPLRLLRCRGVGCWGVGCRGVGWRLCWRLGCSLGGCKHSPLPPPFFSLPYPEGINFCGCTSYEMQPLFNLLSCAVYPLESDC